MPLQLAAFVLSNSKRTMDIFIHATDEFYTNDLYYEDTQSMYIENKHRENLGKAGSVGKNRLQGKNDYKDGGISTESFLYQKIKHCLTIKKFVIIDEQKTFKGFTNLSDNLDKKEYFNKEIVVIYQLKCFYVGKKSFSQGVVIPHKMKNCGDCEKNTLCDEYDKIIKHRKEFSANLNEMKREPPSKFGHMLAIYITKEK